MHARVTIISDASPDAVDEGIANFRDQVLPAVREMGARGGIMLIDRDSGRGLGITLWGDEAAMRESEERANELRRQAAGELGVTAEPRVERYEVAVFETD